VSDGPDPSEPRPLIERIGLAVIAVIVAALFGALGVTALIGNELFLGVMGLIGAVMTVWAAFGSLRRG
jgi:cadmium resistance protein CadD (predicted permease)